MNRFQTETLCPACGFDLGFWPWDGDSASHEICPSCGIHFGYDDAAGGRAAERQGIYDAWRSAWKNAGMPWWSKGRPRPANWDPLAQIQRLDRP